MSQVRWISNIGALGVSPASGWYGDCPQGKRRARLLDDGHVEIDGLGAVTTPMPKAVAQWAPLVLKYAAQYEVPPTFVAGILTVESSGISIACNSEGGQRKTCDDEPDFRWSVKKQQWVPVNKGVGLMQLTDPGVKEGHPNSELLSNPDLNIQLGTKYFAKHWKRYDGDFVKAIAAYNAGSWRCWNDQTPADLKKNPWGAAMWGDYVTNVIKRINGCVDTGLFTPIGPPPPSPVGCPPGQHQENGGCVPDVLTAPPCPEGYAPDSMGGCVPLSVARTCPDGYTRSISGDCVPVSSKPAVATASSSQDATPLVLLAGAAALGYLVFFRDKKDIKRWTRRG